jgi:hypothetical protein
MKRFILLLVEIGGFCVCLEPRLLLSKLGLTRGLVMCIAAFHLSTSSTHHDNFAT